MRSGGLRPTVIALVAASAAALSYLVGRWWLASGEQPVRVTWLVSVLLVVMALAVLVMGRRMWRHHHRGVRVAPLVATRVLGLAQASAVTGALTGGGYLGQAVLLLPDIGFGGRGELALWHGLAGLAGLVVAGCGLLVQSWCRVSDDDDRDEARSSGRT